MLTGRCGCGAVTYRMTSKPMFVHCCHCTKCQRQTGSAYVLNALIEADRVKTDGPLVDFHLPTPSGKGQIIKRCGQCQVAIYSHYMKRGAEVAFVRVGTLDDPSACPPDVQIFTDDKLSWVPLNADIPAFGQFYQFSETWPPDALTRWKAASEGHSADSAKGD